MKVKVDLAIILEKFDDGIETNIIYEVYDKNGNSYIVYADKEIRDNSEIEIEERQKEIKTQINKSYWLI
jgi:hypothetical protein